MQKIRITKQGFAVIEGDTHISKWAEEAGRLDHDTNVLPRALPYIPAGGTVFDVGAYIADHTVAYARKAGDLYAFEPNPVAFECLLHNTFYLDNCKCYNLAFGNQYGHVESVCQSTNIGMATIKNAESGIEIQTIDFFVEKNKINRLDFLKIDAEGFEVEILQGARKTINKFRPVMFIEVNVATLAVKGYTKNDLLQTINDLGYIYRNVYEEQGLGDDQFDVLCFPLS
jgi:FkbM family methyltransferase